MTSLVYCRLSIVPLDLAPRCMCACVVSLGVRESFWFSGNPCGIAFPPDVLFCALDAKTSGAMCLFAVCHQLTLLHAWQKNNGALGESICSCSENSAFQGSLLETRGLLVDHVGSLPCPPIPSRPLSLLPSLCPRVWRAALSISLRRSWRATAEGIRRTAPGRWVRPRLTGTALRWRRSRCCRKRSKIV